MAHYAILDSDNIVTQVVVGKNEYDMLNGMLVDWESYYGGKRTSYSGKIRKNYAGIGYKYDANRDAFIPPKPFPSWVLNEETCLWDAPVAYPTDGQVYQWNEATISWTLINV
jgi:hypothetical protein